MEVAATDPDHDRASIDDDDNRDTMIELDTVI